MDGGNKIGRRVIKSVIAFIVLAVSAWALAYLYADPLIESKIQNAFYRATSGRYEFTYDALEISYRDRGISIKNLHIYPKVDSLEALKNTTLLDLSCTDVSVSEIDFWKTFTGKDFVADELLMENPNLTVWNNDSIKPKAQKEKKNKHVGYLQLEKIRIKNAHALIKRKQNDRLLFETGNLNLFVDGFGISSEMIPLYSHFSLQSSNNSIGIFPNQAFKVGTLFMAGNADYTGLNASEFNITEIDSSLRKALKIPDEIKFSLDAISIESASLADLTEQLLKGETDKIVISRLLLTHPQVSIETKRKSANEPVETTEKLKTVSKKLLLPSIGKVGILDGQFEWIEPGEARPVLQIANIHFMATGVEPRLGEKIPFIYETAELHAGNTVFTYPQSEYTFSTRHVHYRSVTDSLKIDHFKVLPHKSIDSFYMDKKWRVDRFEFHCDTVHCSQLRIADFAFKNEFNPEVIVFKHPEIKAYTDKNYRHDPNHIKPFPLQRLRSIDGNYNIGKIIFQNGTIIYSEKVANSPGIGTLRVENAQLEVSNIKSQVVPTDTAYLRFSCSLGSGSYAHVDIDIPLFGEDEIQYVRGGISDLPFKELNSITENTVLMGFSSGQLDSCWFKFKAVNGKSEGNSLFYYQDLKVKIYKVVDVPSYKTKVLFNKTFLSLAANFLIRKNNPEKDGKPLLGKLAFDRDKQKGPLNFWIRTIMTGLMNTAIDDITELKDLQEEVKSLKSNSKTGLLSKMKANPIRKTIRKQARDARRATKSEDGMK